jgi:prevent-host-death family protein
MIKTVSAYQARTNLGELLNLVYYKGIEVVVEKMGKPVAKIVSLKKAATKEKDLEVKIKRLAGVWDNKDGETISKYTKKFRKKFRLITE